MLAHVAKLRRRLRHLKAEATAHHVGRRSSRLERVAVVVLVIYTLLTVIPDLGRLVQPLGSAGLSTDNDGLITDVAAPFATQENSPAWRAGLRVGDRLDLATMNCWTLSSDRCHDTLAVLAGLGGLNYITDRQTLELWVHDEAGRDRTVTVTATMPPLPWDRTVVLIMDQLAAIAFVLGAGALLWLRPSRTSWGFFLFALWSHPGQTLGLYNLLLPYPAVILIYEFLSSLIEGVGVTGFVYLAISFPTDFCAPRWRLVERSLPALAFVIAAAQVISFCNIFGLKTETLTDALFIGLISLDACALGILLARRSEMKPAEYQRVKWVIAGCALGLPAFLLGTISQSTTLLPVIWGGAQPSPTAIGLLFLFNCILAWFVGVAIWRRQIESVWAPLRRGTRLAVVTAIVAIPIVYVHETLAHYEHELAIPELVWALVAAPMSLLLLQKVHEIVVELSDHLLHPDYFQAERRFKRAYGELRSAKTEAEIDFLIGHVPVEAFDLVSAAVFRRIGQRFERVASYAWDDATVQQIGSVEDQPIMRSVEKLAPVRIRQGQWIRHGVPVDLATPSLAVPVAVDDEVLAVAVYGPQRIGCELNKDQRAMVERFARRAAVSLQRVSLAVARAELARRPPVVASDLAAADGTADPG